jgi:LmbE family N-acetylglucosaminyl deacetylase
MTSLFISPHQDDETLFGAYTLMRQKPVVLVVTDSYIQWKRGDPITMTTRRNETLAAMKLLGCPVVWGEIHDDDVSEGAVHNLLQRFQNFDRIYAPAVQGGNVAHDIIGEVASRLPNVIEYTTYTKEELWTTGQFEIIPTAEEMVLKNQALDCYQSQIQLPSTAPHFVAVRNRSEWLIQ